MTIQMERRRWTVDDYYRMAECGLIGEDERVELIDGEVLRLSPQNVPHASVTAFLNNALVLRYGRTHIVRVQLPLQVGEHSEPEPDFSLVTKEAILTAQRHPTTADLVVEVSDSSLEFDRLRKSRLYAEAGVPEYWVVNLRENVLEVYRQPDGSIYTEHSVLRPGDIVQPQVIPGEGLPVDEFLRP